ncbi:MAG: hypothetical protein ACR2FO_04630 [Actinomycetota bacterium]
MIPKLRWLSAAAVMIAGLVPSSAHGAGHPAPPSATADETKVSILLDTMTLLNGREGDIEVLQILRVHNGSAEAFPGAEGVVVKLPVPESAFDVAPSDDTNPDGMSQGPQGIFTTSPLAPGETLISFIYRIKTSRLGWALRRQVDYPTRNIDLLVGPGLDLVSAPGFDLAARKKLGAVEYRRFRAGPFTAGSVLTADVGFEEQKSPKIWLGFGSTVTVTTVLGVIAFMLARRRKGAPARIEPSGHINDREQLITQIALLDEEFDSGALSEAPYHSRREKLKSKLAELSETAGAN